MTEQEEQRMTEQEEQPCCAEAMKVHEKLTGENIMNENMGFIKTEHFLKRGNNFNILIIHDYNNYLSEHGWCLYVMIFKNHPLFEKASKNNCDYDMDLGDEIYPHWHCGCTYYAKQSTYIKIGCDYKHVGDEELWYESKIPAQVDLDAEELYDFFEKVAKEELNG